MKSNSVGWFEIYVTDTARARAFYETMLGVTLQKLPLDLEMWTFPGDMTAPGASGALVAAPPGMPVGGNSVMIYFACEDCAVEGGRIAAAGGTVVRDKMDIGQYGFIVLGKDPDGNMFGLHSIK